MIRRHRRFSGRLRVWGALLAWICLTGQAGSAMAAEAVFYRAVNVNGPPLVIDGRQWEGKDARDFTATGNTFENQEVSLRPPTDKARAQMIRGSRWGDRVDLTLTNVPAGKWQAFLYVWEDNHSEKFSLLVNDEVVVPEFHSGTAGMWKKLGPWKCESRDGRITVSARAPNHGAANLSGLEVWSEGEIPGAPASLFNDAPTPDQLAFFESKIRPVLAGHCYECHSAQSEKIKGGLVLDSRRGLRKGGDTGPAITPGDPEASLLIEAVKHKSEDLAMPPKKKLPPEEIAALEEWVRMGAPDPRQEDTVAAVQARTAIDWDKARQWWSFQPLKQAPPPEVKDPAWPANDIDRFILAGIEGAGLAPAADAAPRVLIRRLAFDLTGLPPSPAGVEAFIAACGTGSPAEIRQAMEREIDRLLALPAYGERWGRFWLDVVRYADTAGDNSDFPIPQMRLYRDWVIRAFNEDMPYDEFVREQLAGDLLPDRTDSGVIATGYIANSRRFGSRVDDYPRHLTIEDSIDNFGRTFLGLTINCSRCHDHKFDPITQQDYYALYGIFHSTRYPWPGIELEQHQRDLVPLVPPDRAEQALKDQRALEEEQSRLEKELKDLEDGLKNKKGDDRAKQEQAIATARKAVQEQAKKPRLAMAYAVAEAAQPADCAIQLKGDPARPGEVVPRRFLTVFGGAPVTNPGQSSGRLQLAGWLTDKSNPLPARVMVNRLWQYHFGKGLVPTPNDFGKQGKPPTHPELLDWMAARFMEDGWSIRKMHRLILTSRTWRLSGNLSEAARNKDANNELLSAFPRRRLEAEALRDTLLLLGGSLDRTPPEEHPFPPQSEWKFTQHNPFKAVYDSRKRSVYLMTQRIQRHPYLAIFDGADPSASTPRRLTSTTPLQALFLLNDPLVHEQAQRFAARLLKDRHEDSDRFALACELAFARTASEEETAGALAFLQSAQATLKASGTPPEKLEAESWGALVRVLLRLNEFIYLD